jgi:hypothetical protein
MWFLAVAGGVIVQYWVIRLAVEHAMQGVDRRRLRDQRRIEESRREQGQQP